MAGKEEVGETVKKNEWQLQEVEDVFNFKVARKCTESTSGAQLY
jgi:hypothetical protein